MERRIERRRVERRGRRRGCDRDVHSGRRIGPWRLPAHSGSILRRCRISGLARGCSPLPLAWNSFAVQGPIAPSVGDIARMLTVIAGRDDRDPMSYDLDTRAFADTVQSPNVRGRKIAWTPDLNGLLPVDSEIINISSTACDVFRKLGATVDATSPDFNELHEIVVGTRGLSMVALHADKLERWRSELQEGLVWNIEQGLLLTAREIARAELARTRLWQRVHRF